MNNSTQIAIQTLLKVGGGLLVAKGITDNNTVEAIAAGIVALIGLIWNFKHVKAAEAKDPNLV